jgi:RND family efflux transporter MFP subunit
MDFSKATASVLLLCCLLLTACKKEEPVKAKQDTGPVMVRSVAAKAKRIQRVVESVGTFYPYEEAIISAEVDGKVDDVKIDLGDIVSQGQVLVHIADEEQRYLLAQQEAQLRQSLERLGLKDEKDRVKDVKETPEVRRAAADMEEAEQRYRRARSLAEQGIGAQADLDQYQARFNSARAAYDATINQARNLIQEVERYKAVLELQRKKLRDTTVRAPFAGLVKERTVTVGQFTRANTPLLTLVKTDPIRLRVEIPEKMGPWIKPGQIAEILVEAYEDRKISGKIWRVSPTVDAAKRTFVVEALVPNPNNQLKPGSYARARVPTDRMDTVLMVPYRAVNYVLGSNKVYAINNGVIDARDVKLGDRIEEDVEVSEGLAEGDVVALGNLNRLDTGTRVRIGEPKKGPAPKPAE